MDKANNSEHQIPTVDESNEDSISEQDLDDLHSSVVSNISSNVTDPKIRWELRLSESEKKSDKKSDK
ncbi:hypothetical protein, partial [Salmonella sp. s29923]|uniref:hypothetical protein n=1 Tax=Salmonella sp. s29923 TaxID=3159635 RepID=UPI00397EEBC6